MSAAVLSQPKISVIILNYNGQEWLPRCFESLEQQTIFQQIEVIVVDNNSPDGSARLAEEWFKSGGNGRGKLVQNRENLYFCEANNVGAKEANGEYLFFLNNDTWLEPDCLEVLVREVEAAGADAATPLVLNYDDASVQSYGSRGIDLFGMLTNGRPPEVTEELFAACGCSYFIRAEMFRHIGGFDSELLMYVDEADLSWRVQIAGGKIVGVTTARLHHRGAAAVNPAGGARIAEARTSETKRYLANRNGILLLLKDAQHLLLLLLIPHLLLLAVESFAALLIVRRWSYVQKSYLGALAAAFRMMPHVLKWRRQIRAFRKRGDFWMLGFISLVPGRWEEFRRVVIRGAPRVDAK